YLFSLLTRRPPRTHLFPYTTLFRSKNDQAETVLMRLVTGGGLAALRGIHPMRDDGIIRPLLEVTRSDIEACLRERGISARVDRSDRKSTRLNSSHVAISYAVFCLKK